MNLLRSLLTLVFIFYLIFSTNGQGKGTLFMCGGDWRSYGIPLKFKELVGGYGANIVVIPTAQKSPNPENAKATWEDFGFENVVALHTTSRSKANSSSFYEPIKNADGIWFYGGDPTRIHSAYYGTKTYDEIISLYERGGVIGGSSAGAMIQCEYDYRIIVPDYYYYGDSPESRKLFGIEDGFTVLPHIGGRNLWSFATSFVMKHPEIPVMGIDDGSVAILKNDTLTAFGNSVYMYYGKHFDRCRIYCKIELEPDEKFNMENQSRVSIHGNYHFTNKLNFSVDKSSSLIQIENNINVEKIELISLEGRTVKSCTGCNEVNYPENLSICILKYTSDKKIHSTLIFLK